MRLLLALCLIGVTIAANAMPLGLRTAIWGMGCVGRNATANSAFPELGGEATPTSVAEALSGVKDAAVTEHITDAEAYSEFRAWATYVGTESVKTSNTAWMSYALGADAIVPVPQEGDLKIDDASVGEDGKLEAVFSLDGVYVSRVALEERLKTVFGVEGSCTLDSAAFSSDNIYLTLEPTDDGRIRVKVTPPPNAGDSYFMKVKVK